MKLLFLNLFISFRQTINPQVFEIGPVFRAENRLLLKILFLDVSTFFFFFFSNTNRHLCEFMGMDFEMEIKVCKIMHLQTY